MIVTSGLGGGRNAPTEFELPDGDGNVTVIMRVGLTGTRNGEDWPAIGGSVELPAEEARHLIRGGLAVLGEQSKPEPAAAPAPRPAKRPAKA